MRLPHIVALGADIKSQWLIAKGKNLFWGPQGGDLSLTENFDRFKRSLKDMLRKRIVRPDIIACDLHPGYFSTQVANELSQRAHSLISVQHHHAHIASIMCDHNLRRPVLGVAFDGTGLGTDGHMWGGEFLVVEEKTFKRLAHLEYVRMPGGDKVVAEPWRLVVSILGPQGVRKFCDINAHEIKLVASMLSKNINCPFTSSAGRLFDAAAALLGICPIARYEAEGPIKLERLCRHDLSGCYDFGLSRKNGMDIIETGDIFRSMVKDLTAHQGMDKIATKFHNAMAAIIVRTVKRLSQRTGVKDVALSGGVFQNKFLFSKTVANLEKNNLRVFSNRKNPVNDLNIALGQYYVSSRSGKN